MNLESIYCFGSNITAKVNSCLDRPVFKELWNGFCCCSSSIDFVEDTDYGFIVGNPDVSETGDELFHICVNESGISISAKDKKGLICGYMDLLKRIKVLCTETGNELLGVEYCSVSASPAINNRMIHYCVFPDTKLYEIKRFIRLCGVLKYTHIVFEFWGMLKFDVLRELSWPHAFTKDEIKPLLKEANDLGIEIIPMFNHWGHASGSRANHGKHVVLDQNLKLQPLFSDDGWMWKFETSRVRELMRSIREELIELCGEGEYFHLGCDEAYSFELNKETAHTVTDYFNEISAELKSAGRRAIVWGDMFIANSAGFNPDNRYITSCPDEETQNALLSALDKEIIIADWQYNVKVAPVETALVFKRAGFDVLLCPWDKTYGDDSLPPCTKTVKENMLFGLLHTTWHTLSVGMPDVTRAAYLCWAKTDIENSCAYYKIKTSDYIRKAFHPQGNYEKSGWAPYEIGNKTF